MVMDILVSSQKLQDCTIAELKRFVKTQQLTAFSLLVVLGEWKKEIPYWQY